MIFRKFLALSCIAVFAMALIQATATPVQAANFSLAFSDYPPGNIGCGVLGTTPSSFYFFVDYQSPKDVEWKATLLPQGSTPQGVFLDGSGSGSLKAGSGMNQKLSLTVNLGKVPLLAGWSVAAEIDGYVDGVQISRSTAVIACYGEYGFQQYGVTYEPIIQLTVPTGVRPAPTKVATGQASNPQTDGSTNMPACDTTKFIAVSGLPYGPITLKWGPVTGASSYVAIIAIRGTQPNPADVKTLSFIETTETQAFITIRKAGGTGQSIIGVLRKEDVDEAVRSRATFALTVLARSEGKPLCVVNRLISMEPRPTATPLPTSTPVPTTVPPQTNTNGNGDHPTHPKPTAKPCTSIGPCR